MHSVHSRSSLAVAMLLALAPGCTAGFDYTDASADAALDAQVDASLDAGDGGPTADADAEAPTTLTYEPYPPIDAGPDRPRNVLAFSALTLGLRAAHEARGGGQVYDVDLNDYDRDGDLDVIILDQRGLPPIGDLEAPSSVVLVSGLVQEHALTFDDVTTTALEGVTRAEPGWPASPSFVHYAPLETGTLFASSFFGVGWVYEIDTTPRFTLASELPESFEQGEIGSDTIAVGDVDRDGRPDVLSTRSDGPSRLYLHGERAWAERSEFPEPLASTSTAWLADFDDDGRLDLFTMPRATGIAARSYPEGSPPIEAHLLRGVDGGFASTRESAQLETRALNVASCAVGDFDGDGRLDIFQMGRSIDPATPRPIEDLPPDTAQLLLNRGDMTFEVHPLAGLTLNDATPRSRQLITADFDNDGNLDVAMPGLTMMVYRGDGAGGFTLTRGPFAYPDWFAGDVDLDGDIDVLHHGVSDVEVLSNATNGRDFLLVWLRGEDENPDAIGATIRVRRAGEGTLVARRDVLSTTSQPVGYVVHVGLPPSARVGDRFDIEVRWPDGEVGVVRDVPRGARLRVSRGE